MTTGLHVKVAGVWQKIGTTPQTQFSALAVITHTGATTSVGSDGTRVHTWRASGSLQVLRSGWAEVLVCGGGAGAMADAGGGGGVRFGWFWLTADPAPSNFSVTVGAGGGRNVDGGTSTLQGILTVGGGWTQGEARGKGGGGGTAGYSGNGGGGAAGAGNPGPGYVWRGIEYGKGGKGGITPTLPGQGGANTDGAGLAGAVVICCANE